MKYKLKGEVMKRLKLNIYKNSQNEFCLKGNSAGYEALIDSIQMKLKIKDNISMKFTTDNVRVEILLKEDKDYLEERSPLRACPLDKGPCLELTPSMIPSLPLKVQAKNSFMKKIRRQYRRAYEPWSAEEDALLDKKYFLGLRNYQVFAHMFQRTVGSILSRLHKRKHISQLDIDEYSSSKY